MFYAKLHPRGFSNEFDLLAFTTKALRDQFVSAVPRSTWSDYYKAWVQSDNSSARAYAITAREAERLTLAERKQGYDREGNFVREAWGINNNGQTVSEPLTLREYFNSGKSGCWPVEQLDDRGFIVDAAGAL